MLNYVLDFAAYLVKSLINLLIEGIAAIITLLGNLLPTSPFIETHVSFLSSVKYIEYVEWLLPISSMLSLLGLLLVAMLVYYAIKIILRFTKMVE